MLYVLGLKPSYVLGIRQILKYILELCGMKSYVLLVVVCTFAYVHFLKTLLCEMGGPHLTPRAPHMMHFTVAH